MSPLSAEAFSTLAPAIGWALVHFVWQGTAIAALAAGGMALVRGARARYAVAVGVLLLMIAAPLITVALAHRAAPAAAIDDGRTAPQRDAAGTGLSRGDSIGLSSAVPGRSWTRVSLGTSGGGVLPPTLLRRLVAIWLVGVALFSLRMAGGLWLVQRLRRKSCAQITGRLRRICAELQDEIGVRRVVRYCQTAQLGAPAVIGWFRPVVLLPV